MPYSVEGKLVVAISSRALFDFEEENRVFEKDGEQAYIALQYGRLDVPARQGVAFPLVKKLLAFNTSQTQRVEVVVLSKNDPVSGLRVFRSAKLAGLAVERRDQLHQRLDVAADHAVARLHALDGRQRETRSLREGALIDSGERAGGAQLSRRDHMKSVN